MGRGMGKVPLVFWEYAKVLCSQRQQIGLGI